MPWSYLFVSLRYLRSCSFPGPRRRRLVFLCFSLRSALTADWQQHFLLSRCGLAWPLALCWFRPTVICDAAFQGIHQVDYVFALWPRAFAAMGLPLCFDRSIRSAQLRNDPQIFRARMWRFSDCASRAFTCSFSANVQAALFVPVPMLLSELIGRFQSAVYPAGVTRFHGVLNERLRYVLAVRTFKRPQIGTVRTGLDPSRHQAALTFRTKRPFDRK